MKFQGDILNFCDSIHVFVSTLTILSNFSLNRAISCGGEENRKQGNKNWPRLLLTHRIKAI